MKVFRLGLTNYQRIVYNIHRNILRVENEKMLYFSYLDKGLVEVRY